MATMKNLIDKIKYGFLSVFLLISVLGQAQDCIDFENQTGQGNWRGNAGYGIASLSVITSPGTNTTSHLFFIDATGGSRAINDVDFTGNWLTQGNDPCLCFDYRVTWSDDTKTTSTGAKFEIYWASTKITSINMYLDFARSEHLGIIMFPVSNGGGQISGLRATFISDPLKDPITKDKWQNYCLPLGDSSITQLPSNNFGYWIIQEFNGNGGKVTLSGAAAVTAWLALIKDVQGVALSSDYHDRQSEEISFDNFCWACVDGSSQSPCDIDGFEATLTENNGSFIVTINGGSVPIQQVEISMVDYHIEYSDADCKPNNMGNFGTLSTTTSNLESLILNLDDLNTSSLSWLLGEPAIINTGIDLDIIDPLTLNLDCCDVDFSFCLKVWVQDVNCNICEVIVCYSSDQN